MGLGDQPIIAQFIQSQLQQNLNVDITLEPLDPPSFGAKVFGGRQFQVISVGWSAEYPDPEYFLSELFGTMSPNNLGGYSNPDFDGLSAMATTEQDAATRLNQLRQAHEILIDDVPVAPFFYEESFFLKKPSVQGLVLTGMDGAVPGDIRLAEVSIGAR